MKVLILANKLLGKSSLLPSPKLLQTARVGAWRKKKTTKLLYAPDSFRTIPAMEAEDNRGT